MLKAGADAPAFAFLLYLKNICSPKPKTMKNFPTFFLLFLCFILSSNLQASYCEAKGLDSSQEWISKVSVAYKTYQTGNDGGYSFTGKEFDLVWGECFFLLLEADFAGATSSVHWGVWVDYNFDGDFYDLGEEVFIGTGSSLGTTTYPIQGPALGETRMRVVMSRTGPPSPCGLFARGEVEDYVVHMYNAPFICTARGTSTHYEWVETVDINGTPISTGNNNGLFRNGCYSYLLVQGETATFTLSPGYAGSSYPERWKIWIDWNNNDDFTDPGEEVYSSGGGITGPASGSFAVPTVLPGGYQARIRIAMRWGTAPSACGVYHWGEVEEFQVYVREPIGSILANVDELSPPPASENTTAFSDLRSTPSTLPENTFQLFPNPAQSQVKLQAPATRTRMGSDRAGRFIGTPSASGIY